MRWGLRVSACAARDVPVQGFHAIPRPFCALLRAAHTRSPTGVQQAPAPVVRRPRTHTLHPTMPPARLPRRDSADHVLNPPDKAAGLRSQRTRSRARSRCRRPAIHRAPDSCARKGRVGGAGRACGRATPSNSSKMRSPISKPHDTATALSSPITSPTCHAGRGEPQGAGCLRFVTVCH